MTIIAFFVVVIVGWTIYTLILIGMENINTRSNKDKYQLLSELGSKLNLSFSSHLVAGKKFIALDGIKKILLVFEENYDLNQPYIIELARVRAISLKQRYGKIAPGKLQYKPLGKFLKTIDLRFEYANQDKAVVLSFYDSERDDFRDLPRISRNAKNWQMILSKMLMPQKDKETKNLNMLTV